MNLILERARAVPEGTWGLNWTVAQVDAECERGAGWVSLDEADDVQAFLFLHDLSDSSSSERVHEILLLATEPALRGKGVMSQMLRHVFKQIGDGGKLWLEVHEANVPARQLYEKLGLVKVGERKRYYADGASAVLYNYG